MNSLALRCTLGGFGGREWVAIRVFPYVYAIEGEHVVWHEKFDGELHHQTRRAVLPHGEDGFVRVGGQTRQVLALLFSLHRGQRHRTCPQQHR